MNLYDDTTESRIKSERDARAAYLMTAVAASMKISQIRSGMSKRGLYCDDVRLRHWIPYYQMKYREHQAECKQAVGCSHGKPHSMASDCEDPCVCYDIQPSRRAWCVLYQPTNTSQHADDWRAAMKRAHAALFEEWNG